MAAYCNKYVEDDPSIADVMNAVTADFWPWLDRWPIERGESPLALTPDYEDYYFLVATSGDWPGPNEFWKYPGHNFEMYYEEASDIPMAHLTGWYDTYTQAEGENFAALSKIKKSPQMLLIGPRTHTTNWFNTYSGNAEFGPAASDNYNEFILRWMDQYLKEIDTGLAYEPPVRLWVMGGGSGRKTPEGRLDVGGEWFWEDEYPLARTRYRKFYFWPDGGLKPAPVPKHKGKPRFKGKHKGSSITFTYDPENPVPSIGGNISAFGRALVAGGFNQVLTEDFYVRGVRNNGQPLSERPDVISFQTDPLKEDMELVGPIKVILYASSSAIDTDFTAKIIDVYPPNQDYPEGYALNLEDGIVRARYRKGRIGDSMTPEFIKPGKIYEFTIRPYDIGNRFKKGHRLRVDISSSNYPRFDLNPNTGEPLAQHTHTIPARNTIYMSREYPSHVVVPLIPSNGGKPFIPCDDDEEEDNNEEMDERENGGLTAR
jgi:putative CocE/NonD family hydrolase